ncbi:MAG: hypothetical protein FWD11_02020 [Micrococcales bacterium]|nr:hypothetical protein [Micrococcales bacterium]
MPCTATTTTPTSPTTSSTRPGVIGKPVQGAERKVDEIKGTRDKKTKGHNERDFRRRGTRI